MATVLIVQSDPQDRQTLAAIFEELGKHVRTAGSLAEANAQLRTTQPDLLVLDVGLLGDDWPKVIRQLGRRLRGTRILPTASTPEELPRGKSNGAPAERLLYSPYTRHSLELSLLMLDNADAQPLEPPRQEKPPSRRRIALRTKITLPYVLLAVFMALASAYIVTRIVLDSVEERFTNQLIEAGRLSSEWMVLEEDRLLETLRLMANTEGTAEAILAGDSDRLRELAFPIAVNAVEEAVDILDADGVNLLSLHHRPGGNLEDYEVGHGNEVIRQWAFARNVLQGQADALGDKFAGVVQAPWGATFYVSGPVLDDQGRIVGVILIGKSIPTIVRQMREATLAQATLYAFDGQPFSTTFLEAAPLEPVQVADVLLHRDAESLIRSLDVANITYREILGTWEARDGLDLGLIGVSLPQTFLVHTSRITRLQIFGFVALALVLVILVGVSVAERITRPLLQVVRASVEVARGNLRVRVEPKGDDEIAVLADSFNNMVGALQRSQVELLEAYDSTLEGWSKALEMRDDDTEGHTRRVVETTVRLARSLGVEEEPLLQIRRGALLHDFGKMAIPDRVLLKPGPLTQDEWSIMRRHPMYAYEMLSGIVYLRQALDIPRCHHERWDGSGYPFGLKGEEIPLSARIFAVVDVWDALSSDRPYRSAWPPEEVLKYLREHAGTQFDPRVVECFLLMIGAELNGSHPPARTRILTAASR